MLFDRTQLERLEAAQLAPYAAQSGRSRGREYPERESLHRTAFQKDRDRVNHTTAFRRLQYKTQVFVNYEGDYYRTRLTHTLEVAQVARSIARALGLNPDLAETIAFAHDLGHPPFGHSGERVLQGLMEGAGGFDHNKQSLRVVTYLEERYPGFRGLNLTWETREGIVKHETRYDLPDAQGYEPSLRPSLEAQIVNLADEIAYNAHDLDDGLRSGLLRPGQLPEVPLLRDLMGELGFHPDRFAERERRVFIRELLGLLIQDTITATHQLLEKNGIESLEAVRSHPAPLAAYSADLSLRLEELRSFLYDHLYHHHYVVRQVGKSKFVLERLFVSYVEDPLMLPPQARKAAEVEGIHRAVCDYLAGMTDRYALDEYARLFEPDHRRV
ncbi:deoxyguanosinetriphosphate triphosphohydrolase [Meiothermus granaticius]|uniref:Deoxyguanosinetriphosphate triphosphohydrolase-like protein n=1 Tax=Meiothermus granaticius NBRC 107808 TaxID=1227551 RepID=A0A399FDJ0_9DEIN|nr:deoxyguanosinetriphosphate triphosphohydrolase [Meiothermus granaticius]MCL6526486.1 deoxyguanosinetriphosphate triphosphohydrolase [Thermaceae bacterium]RIH92891.1 Deoxyguanosinetriphosphate triphosphohydrolase-like protein [Meiothermus granaticius NBRC 107808]GEM86747.1 deoxyguanosinetriphosphate triphosphohydrolase-like protein [Meiothermus granaticius NBRC 107808]